MSITKTIDWETAYNIFVRDDKTCDKCGEYTVVLHIHASTRHSKGIDVCFDCIKNLFVGSKKFEEISDNEIVNQLKQINEKLDTIENALK